MHKLSTLWESFVAKDFLFYSENKKLLIILSFSVTFNVFLQRFTVKKLKKTHLSYSSNQPQARLKGDQTCH